MHALPLGIDRHHQVTKVPAQHTRSASAAADLHRSTSSGLLVLSATQPAALHRWDHHLQGKQFTPAASGPGHVALRRRARSVAAAAHATLRRMSRSGRVIFAASSAYDHVYLRRELGVEAVPWPGLAVQLSSLPYTGTRREVLFCCGERSFLPGDQTFRQRFGIRRVLLRATASSHTRSCLWPTGRMHEECTTRVHLHVMSC